MNGWYFALGLIVWPFVKLLATAINRAVIEYRQKKFLKLVNVTFPDKEQITFISLDTSDKRAMAKLERQIRDQFDNIQEPPEQDRRRDRGRAGDVRRPPTRPRQDPPRSVK